jgi:L-cysteate sulfo-lyase
MIGAALERLRALPSTTLFPAPTPVEPLTRLRGALGGGPRLLVKRDDAIPFGFGGNKVRKLQLVVAQAVAAGADTLVTTGGVQSNHARATAAAAAKLGLGCTIVANGARPDRLSANALLDSLLGAEVEYVSSREERAPAMRRVAERLRAAGRTPYEIPLGASTPTGAAAFARAIGELLEQTAAPDVIVHASSSGGTQAGLVAGCALHGLSTRVIGVSADDSAADISATVRRIIEGLAGELGVSGSTMLDRSHIEVDDRFVGTGYGIPTDASREAQSLFARTEALFVDHTYTAKAAAALIAYVREKRFSTESTLLFWHTGGQVGLFA